MTLSTSSGLRETHDIIHVLPGFGIDGDSELGLRFNLAQTRSPLAVMLIFGGMLAALQDDEPLAPCFAPWHEAFFRTRCRSGDRARDGEGWDRPLTDWRRELKLA